MIDKNNDRSTQILQLMIRKFIFKKEEFIIK